MICYLMSADNIEPAQLTGFFEGWPNPPSPETHLGLLRNSSSRVIAVDPRSNHGVGFVTAIADGVLAAYIPFLEVLPSYRHRGIAHELMRRMSEHLAGLYMIDLQCDREMQPFCSEVGMTPGHGMQIRNYGSQAGRIRSGPEPTTQSSQTKSPAEAGL